MCLHNVLRNSIRPRPHAVQCPRATRSVGSDGEPARWISRHASVTFTVGGYQLPWAGMNDQGLVLSTMALNGTQPPGPEERAPLDWGPLWMQYILDTCATIDDVAATDAMVRIVQTVDHYLLSDRSGHSAVVELLEGAMVIHSGNDLPVAALPNHGYQELVESWQSHRQSGSYVYLPDSQQRFCQAADQVVALRENSSEAADHRRVSRRVQ